MGNELNTRRRLIGALSAGALSMPLSSFAQPKRAKVARIGLLDATSASSRAKDREALVAGLRELGYIEGKNLVIEWRYVRIARSRISPQMLTAGIHDQIACNCIRL